MESAGDSDGDGPDASDGSWRTVIVDRRREVVAYGAVTLVWLGSYVWIVAAGRRFTAELAQGGWQFAPYDLLVARPVTTSFGMTVQPPLWNLVVGATARWLPFGDVGSLQFLIALIALAIGLLATRLVLLVGLGAGVAAVIGCLAAFQPSTWQTMLGVGYELPTAMLLLLLLNVIVDGAGRLSRRQLIIVIVVATMLSLVRTLYHPLWLVAAFAVFAFMARGSVGRRQIALICGIPVLLVGALIVKNDVTAGTPSLASWEGMNLLRSVQVAIPEDDLQRDYERGDISGVALIPAFSAYTEYAEFMPDCVARGDGVLDTPFVEREVRSPFTGVTEVVLVPNFSYRCYQPIFQQARDDALGLMVRHPDRWLAARGVAARAWFTDYPPAWSWLESVHDATHVRNPTADLAGWNDMYPLVIFDQDISLIAVGGFLILLVASGCCLVRVIRRRWSRTDVLVLATFAFYVTTMVPSIVFELGEQPRFRSVIDPMMCATVGVIVVKTYGAIRDRRLYEALGARIAGASLIEPRRSAGAALVSELAAPSTRRGPRQSGGLFLLTRSK